MTGRLSLETQIASESYVESRAAVIWTFSVPFLAVFFLFVHDAQVWNSI